jgi:L-gulonate 3-dehydrogenase
MWDKDPTATEAARGYIAERLPELREAGLLRDDPAAVLARIAPRPTLAAALDGAVYVQESSPERVELKRALFAEMDEIAAPSTILASSTSGIPASAFTEALRGRARCLVAHPINPPYLVPVVELCPAPWTDAAVVAQARSLMQRAGQVPATVTREVTGFVVNRLQAVLLSEAFRLVEGGYVTPQDLDKTLKDGLGLRWSFMGPFETIDLNAPGGLADYCARYGGLYAELQRQFVPCEFTPALVGELDKARREALPMADLPARHEWRDRRLIGLMAQKAKQPV